MKKPISNVLLNHDQAICPFWKAILLSVITVIISIAVISLLTIRKIEFQ